MLQLQQERGDKISSAIDRVAALSKDRQRLTINDQDAECAVVATDALEGRKSI
jgi:hypothetical protein